MSLEENAPKIKECLYWALRHQYEASEKTRAEGEEVSSYNLYGNGGALSINHLIKEMKRYNIFPSEALDSMKNDELEFYIISLTRGEDYAQYLDPFNSFQLSSEINHTNIEAYKEFLDHSQGLFPRCILAPISKDPDINEELAISGITTGIDTNEASMGTSLALEQSVLRVFFQRLNESVDQNIVSNEKFIGIINELSSEYALNPGEFEKILTNYPPKFGEECPYIIMSSEGNEGSLSDVLQSFTREFGDPLTKAQKLENRLTYCMAEILREDLANAKLIDSGERERDRANIFRPRNKHDGTKPLSLSKLVEKCKKKYNIEPSDFIDKEDISLFELKVLSMLERPELQEYASYVDSVESTIVLNADNIAKYKEFVRAMPEDFHPREMHIQYNMKKSIEQEVREANIEHAFYTKSIGYSECDVLLQDRFCREFMILFSDPKSDLSKEEFESKLESLSEKFKSPDGIKVDRKKMLSMLKEMPQKFKDELSVGVLSEGQATPIMDFVDQEYKKAKMPERIVSVQDSRDLWFNAVLVNKDNYKKWESFAETSKPFPTCGGKVGFIPALQFHDNPKTEVWVLLASEKKYEGGPVEDIGPEMYVSCSTSENSPFSAHMGIQRIESKKVHKYISGKLHTFGAQLIRSIHPEKKYMFNVPLETTRHSLLKKIEAQKELDTSQILYDAEPDLKIENLETRIEYLQKEIPEIEKKISQSPKLSASYKMHKKKLEARLHQYELQKDQLERTEAGDFVPFVKYSPSRKGEYKENLIVEPGSAVPLTITPEMQRGEFAWFFNHRYEIRNSSPDCPMIGVKLENLAKLEQVKWKVQDQEVASGIGDKDVKALKATAELVESPQKPRVRSKSFTQKRAKPVTRRRADSMPSSWKDRALEAKEKAAKAGKVKE